MSLLSFDCFDTFYMSISYNIKKEGIADSVDIPGSEISVFLLQKLLAEKLKVKEHELVITNVYTGFKLNPMEIIKDKATVNVEKLCKSDTKLSINGIVSNEELAEMGRSGRFFMIKSSNEENIQKAREFSVWATTYSNQVNASSHRTNFALPCSTANMCFCSLLQIDLMRLRVWLAWKRSPAKLLRKLSGQE